jgi:hypothetical protein
MISRNGRFIAALIAMAGCIALLSQLNISIGLMAAQGHGAAYSLWRYLGYFTILTNLMAAAMFTRVALNRWPGGRTPSASALTACVMYISFVMLVYHLLLSELFVYQGIQKLTDVTLHYVVPALSLIWWLVFAPKTPLTLGSTLRWLIYPLAYCAYALVRGHFENWYPYPFIDVSQIGLGQSLLNSAMLTLAFLVIGMGFVAMAKLKIPR